MAQASTSVMQLPGPVVGLGLAMVRADQGSGGRWPVQVRPRRLRGKGLSFSRLQDHRALGHAHWQGHAAGGRPLTPQLPSAPGGAESVLMKAPRQLLS